MLRQMPSIARVRRSGPQHTNTGRQRLSRARLFGTINLPTPPERSAARITLLPNSCLADVCLGPCRQIGRIARALPTLRLSCDAADVGKH